MLLSLSHSNISDRRWIPTPPPNDASIPCLRLKTYETGHHHVIRTNLEVCLDPLCLLVGDVAAAQVGLLGHAKKSPELTEGSLSERQPTKRKKIAVLTKIFMGEAADFARSR